MTQDRYQARELVWLRRLRDLSQRLGSEQDPGALPKAILRAAREMTEAERAVLVSVEGPDSSGKLRVHALAASGFSARDLAGPEGAVSRTVVERCIADGRAVLTTQQEDANLIHASTLVRRGVLSVVCVPLYLRGTLRGALYLDHRGREAHFRQRDLPILQAFATQSALCLELTQEPAPITRTTQRLLIGEAPPLVALREELARAARSTEPTLICGEPGTELTLAARELHALAHPGERAFREVSATTLPRLLGNSAEPGWLGQEGTVCIQDVETLEPALQRVLASAVAEGSYTLPDGSTHSVRARVVATTHVDLEARIRDGKFLAELYYRLDVQRVIVPPLRQRTEDLEELCRLGFQRLNAPELSIGEDAMERLKAYSWPGNALELERELRRLRSLGPHRFRPEHLSDAIRDGRGVVATSEGFTGKTLGELEEQMVRQALEETNGVKSKAARKLGIPRSSLYHLIARYKIEL
ncbi:MAG: sigma 54-interacting transcriptional regulator [Planctomycetota bacterium]